MYTVQHLSPFLIFFSSFFFLVFHTQLFFINNTMHSAFVFFSVSNFYSVQFKLLLTAIAAAAAFAIAVRIYTMTENMHKTNTFTFTITKHQLCRRVFVLFASYTLAYFILIYSYKIENLYRTNENKNNNLSK